MNKWWGIFIHISLQLHSFVFPVSLFFFLFFFSFISHFSIFWTIQLDWHCLIQHSNDSTEAEYMSHVGKRAKALMRQSFIFYSYFWMQFIFFPWIYDYDQPNKVWTPEIKLPKHFLALHKLYYTWCFILHTLVYVSYLNETVQFDAGSSKLGALGFDETMWLTFFPVRYRLL